MSIENLVGEMTLGQLAQRTGRSVVDIVALAMGNLPAKPKGIAVAAEPRRVDASTPAARAVYDMAVLQAVKDGGNSKIADVLAKTGGTIEQCRTSLNRLIAGKKVTRTGNTRAAFYTAR